MNDFDWDALQKKRVAQGAMHKKNGSKSKKCTMPSDYLSKKEREALNGPVTEINLNQPMDWRSFKGLSDSLKVEYIKHLQEIYRPTCLMWGRMFGVTNHTVNVELRRLGINDPQRRCSKSEDRERWAVWNAFCKGVVGGGDNQTPEEEKADTEALEAEEDVSKLADAVLAAIHPPVDESHPGRLDMTFTGWPDELTMTILRNMFHDQNVKVRISAEVVTP